MASTRIFIGDRTYTTTEELTKILSSYQVESTSIPINRLTGHPVGYALVNLSNSSEAERVVAELSKKDILVRKVPIACELELYQSGNDATSGCEACGVGMKDMRCEACGVGIVSMKDMRCEACGVGIAGMKAMRDIIFTLYAIGEFNIDEIHHVLVHCTGAWTSESELSSAIQGWKATQQPRSWPDHAHEESEEGEEGEQDKGFRLCLCGV